VKIAGLRRCDALKGLADVARGSAAIVVDPVIQRQVESLRQRPRSILELVAQLAAELGLGPVELRTKLEPYCRLSAEALAVTGGDRLPPPLPLSLVRP
jgi:hypothetical protein